MIIIEPRHYLIILELIIEKPIKSSIEQFLYRQEFSILPCKDNMNCNCRKNSQIGIKIPEQLRDNMADHSQRHLRCNENIFMFPHFYAVDM